MLQSQAMSCKHHFFLFYSCELRVIGGVSLTGRPQPRKDIAGPNCPRLPRTLDRPGPESSNWFLQAGVPGLVQRASTQDDICQVICSMTKPGRYDKKLQILIASCSDIRAFYKNLRSRRFTFEAFSGQSDSHTPK